MKQSDKKESKLLTLKQACELFNWHPNILRAWDKKATLLPCVSAHEAIDDTEKKM